MHQVCTQRSSSRQFHCKKCDAVVPPSIKGHTPVDRLFCIECSLAKRIKQNHSSSSCTSTDTESILQKLLDTTPPKVKRMWKMTEEALPIQVKRKIQNPKRFVAPDDNSAVYGGI